MKLEEQVCSLELAKKLKELGVKQKSSFYWIPFKCWNPKTKQSDDEMWKLEDKSFTCSDLFVGRGSAFPDFNFEGQKNLKDQWSRKYSAFTVAELGEMLPTLGIVWCKSSNGNGKDFWWGKTNYPSLEKQIEADDFTEADARARMLIHLIAKGIKTTNAKGLDSGFTMYWLSHERKGRR